jgi:hypothetical protein
MTELNTNEVTGLTVLPNGSAAVSAFDKLVERFRLFAKRSAENTLELGKILLEVKEHFPDRIEAFCASVGLKNKSPTFWKLLKIGQEATRFEPFSDQVPGNWTTVYKLAKLKKDNVVHDPRFGPMMTGAEVEEIANDRKPCNRPRRSSADCAIDFSGLDDQTKLDLRKQLVALADSYGFKYAFSARITALKANTPDSLNKAVVQ